MESAKSALGLIGHGQIPRSSLQPSTDSSGSLEIPVLVDHEKRPVLWTQTCATYRSQLKSAFCLYFVMNRIL